MSLKTIIEEAKKKLIFPYKNAPIVTMNGEELLTIDVVKLEKCITKACTVMAIEILRSAINRKGKTEDQITYFLRGVHERTYEIEQNINKFINE